VSYRIPNHAADAAIHARRWAALAVLCLSLVAVAVVRATRPDLDGVLDWAWERHQNPLSWYIRPLFFIPFAFFAYRRSWSGILLTLIALATSIAWFPVPDRVDPNISEFLEAERDWILGEWTSAKFAVSALAPLCFVLLGAAFWRRAWSYGVLVMVLAASGKVLWSFSVGDGAAQATVLPATVGLVACIAAVVVGVRRLRGPSAAEAPST
jgi:hypothetical protein